MAWIDWLDWSADEREAVLELLSTPKDKGTLDELGIGSVRDAIADHLFPPINTIQTRAKYFFFVPWIYRKVEQGGAADERLADIGAANERRLIKALLEDDDDDKAGLIGIEAGEELKRLPSSIYWNGLRRLGIFRDASALSEYLRELSTIRRQTQQRQRSALEASGHARDTLEHVEPVAAPTLSWDRGLPAHEPDFLLRSRFRLTLEQATYLREKVLAMATPTGRTCLLQWLLQHASPSDYEDMDVPWQLLDTEAGVPLPAHLQDDLRHARNFSLCVEGVTTLYYFFLAQDLRLDPAEHRRELALWADSMQPHADELRAWHDAIPGFWSWVRLANPRLQRDVPFLTAWLGALASVGFSPAGPDALVTSELRRLLQTRERALKGPLARMSNPGPLSRWKPVTHGGPLSYRWPSACQFLVDVQAGLASREAQHA